MRVYMLLCSSARRRMSYSLSVCPSVRLSTVNSKAENHATFEPTCRGEVRDVTNAPADPAMRRERRVKGDLYHCEKKNLAIANRSTLKRGLEVTQDHSN